MQARTSMPVRSVLWRALLVILLLAGLNLAAATPRTLAAGHVTFDGSPGTDAPPATLGPYTMTPFGPDSRDPFEMVTTIPGPTGDLVLSTTASHRLVPGSWATWSHGYEGSVYFVDDETEVTITLPPNTLAFYLYVEPNSFGEYPFTVEADGASSGVISVEGYAGAKYFGFYSTTAAITSVTVSADESAGGFAIGEFGIASGVPAAPGSPRADVAAIIYGGWSGMPVSAWVGGTQQPVLYTAPNHQGYPAVLFTFWPPSGTGWQVTVSPALPAGLDPARWEIKLLWIETGGGFTAATSPSVTVRQGTQHVLHFQLIDKGVAP